MKKPRLQNSVQKKKRNVPVRLLGNMGVIHTTSGLGATSSLEGIWGDGLYLRCSRSRSKRRIHKLNERTEEAGDTDDLGIAEDEHSKDATPKLLLVTDEQLQYTPLHAKDWSMLKQIILPKQ